MEQQDLPDPNPPLTSLATIGQGSLRDYTMPMVDGIHSSIKRTRVQGNNF